MPGGPQCHPRCYRNLSTVNQQKIAMRVNSNNVDHFCLQLKPIFEEEIKAHLESNGVKTGEFDNRYGAQGFGKSVYIKDPEGNVVELRSQIQVSP